MISANEIDTQEASFSGHQHQQCTEELAKQVAYISIEVAASLFSRNGKDIAQKLTIVLRTQLIKPIASLDKMEQSVEICKIDCIFCHIKYV